MLEWLLYYTNYINLNYSNYRSLEVNMFVFSVSTQQIPFQQATAFFRSCQLNKPSVMWKCFFLLCFFALSAYGTCVLRHCTLLMTFWETMHCLIKLFILQFCCTSTFTSCTLKSNSHNHHHPHPAQFSLHSVTGRWQVQRLHYHQDLQ